MNFNIEEAQKIIKYIKSMQTIIKTSTNSEQIERIKKDIAKYIKKLQAIVPDFNPAKETIQELELRLQNISNKKDISYERNLIEDVFQQERISWETRIPYLKATPHSNDYELNFLYSVISLIQKEYFPAITEQQIQLDYTHSQERQVLRYQFDELLRDLQTLIETIEDYARAETPDFREQLLKMKNKQTRNFIFNSNEYLKKLRDFIAKLLIEYDKKTFVIKNPESKINFDPRFDEAKLLHGYSIRQALEEFLDLLEYTIKKINLPDFKQKKL
ncbi:MAG: hypothetical protein NZ853_05315 [Leptospiraceae bacterium]|nr:hypothetical protein [Leptospiraceae bacterium]MDW7976633.1 hypothetical protein [Leptospiraceae bacterium]